MGTYTNKRAIQHVKSCNPKVIVECGTCNGEDTIDIFNTYKPDKLFTFEANPENHRWCREKLGQYPNIQFVDQAVSDITGTTTFYPGNIHKCRFPNCGISSMYPFKPGHPEFVLQEPVTIPCTRLDDFLKGQNVEKVDVVCLDVQGAELKALVGLGDYLNTVSVIISEVWYNTYYDGSPTYNDLIGFLKPYGFKHTDLFRYKDFGDAMWTR